MLGLPLRSSLPVHLVGVAQNAQNAQKVGGNGMEWVGMGVGNAREWEGMGGNGCAWHGACDAWSQHGSTGGMTGKQPLNNWDGGV